MFLRAQTCCFYFLSPCLWQASPDIIGYCIWHQLYLLHDFQEHAANFLPWNHTHPLYDRILTCVYINLNLIWNYWIFSGLLLPNLLLLTFRYFSKFIILPQPSGMKFLTALQVITFPSSCKVGIGFSLPLTTLSLATVNKYAQPLIFATLV